MTAILYLNDPQWCPGELRTDPQHEGAAERPAVAAAAADADAALAAPPLPRRAGGDGGALRCFLPFRSTTSFAEVAESTASNGAGMLTGGRASGRAPEMLQGEVFVDVVPRGGTLVLFDAGRIEHKVLPCRRDRYALTCWIAGSDDAPPVTR